jgi:hypothetical protein
VAVDHIHVQHLQKWEHQDLLQIAPVITIPCVLWVCIYIWHGINIFIWCAIESVLQCYKQGEVAFQNQVDTPDQQNTAGEWPTHIISKLLQCRLENLSWKVLLLRTMVMVS